MQDETHGETSALSLETGSAQQNQGPIICWNWYNIIIPNKTSGIFVTFFPWYNLFGSQKFASPILPVFILSTVFQAVFCIKSKKIPSHADV